ncbi:MAG: acyl-CoA dehydrogenase family protein [Nitrospinae bacterium]|nr:acyl-CoA dehydrogenase family protein [Nitrospinota bacterium]
MALDYSVFKSTDQKSERPKSQNFFKYNPHLKFLIQRYDGNDPELTLDILNMIGELSAQHLAPQAAENDRTGCRLQWQVGSHKLSQSEFHRFHELKGNEARESPHPDDVVGQALNDFRSDPQLPVFSEVLLPEGAQEQVQSLREQSLIGLPLPDTYGGGGLSQMMAGAALLFYAQADASLFLRVMLTEGVADLIDTFGDDDLKKKYIPLLCSDDPGNHYIGAMVITEPEAGSDLKGITVKAVKKGNQYLLGGRKIFITNPDADVCVVLARVEGAPTQTLEGLTLFLVPKYLKDDQGQQTRNPILIENLEEKLGIHSSPTGTLLFKGAEAYLIGNEGDGLKQMLYLMNKSRLGIGTQGLGIAEQAFLESAVFCTQRKQFGKTLAELPLMQEILANMRIENEAVTSLIFKAYHYIDQYRGLRRKNQTGEMTPADREALEKYQKLIRILTPLAKYRGSEWSVAASDMAVSNLGGYGYIVDFPVERLMRDAKITTIYEGTNNMMVLDIQRSIAKESTLEVLIEDIESHLQAVTNGSLIPFKDLVFQGVESIHSARENILKSEDPDTAQQIEARRFAELLIRVYEAGLMLEEAQYLIDQENDWRKAVMAMKYITDKLPHSTPTLSRQILSVKYFDSIFYMEKVESLSH